MSCLWSRIDTDLGHQQNPFQRKCGVKGSTVDGDHAPLPQSDSTHLSPALKWTLRARRPQDPTTFILFMRQNLGHVSESMRASMMQRYA